MEKIQKKDYNKPQLVKHGDVSSLTKFNMSGGSDLDGGPEQ